MIDFFEEFRIDISNMCPLKCSYCTVSSDSTQIISLETFKKGIELFENITTIPGRRVQLFGAGEPLCAIQVLKEFFKDYLNPLNFKFELITNGILLTKENIEFLENNNIEIHLSLDGTKEIHDQHRRLRKTNGPSWDIIMNNLQFLNKPLNGLICTMSSSTIDKMPYMYNSLQKIEAENFFLNFDKYDNYSELQKKKYLQHLRNFCDRDYYYDNGIKFKGKGTKCSNFLSSENFLDPQFFKSFRNTIKDLKIDINGNLSIDLPQHTSQMAKGAKEMGFLKNFANVYDEKIDWTFCEEIKNKFGEHFENIYFENEKNPEACQYCKLNNICQPLGKKDKIPYKINDNCCFYYKTTIFPYFYLRGVDIFD